LAVRKSSITKLYGRGANSDFARRLGLAIRLHRLSVGLTQTQLGFPLTKAFVSQVERGHTVPSLAALSLMADRLQISMGLLLEEVNGGLPRVYTPADENQHQAASRNR
jgi:transcriptional regulator with XRE-family HTH domain